MINLKSLKSKFHCATITNAILFTIEMVFVHRVVIFQVLYICKQFIFGSFFFTSLWWLGANFTVKKQSKFFLHSHLNEFTCFR